MPLFEVRVAATLPDRMRDRLRHVLAREMSALMGVESRFVAVIFRRFDESETLSALPCAVVYLSAGRPADFRRAVLRFTADALCTCTGCAPKQATVIIQELRLGSVAVGGRIVNRNGPAAEAVIRAEKQESKGKEVHYAIHQG